nr:hypothetical protein [Candidatus Sigynarchaeota archaeon]
MGEMADWINQDDPEEDRDQYAAWLEEKLGPFRITKIDNTKCRYHGCDNHKGQVEFYSEDVCARCHADDIKYAAWLGEKLERIKEENMTDKYKGLVVTLDKDYRDDDAESIITAIKMIKGVLEVVPAVANHADDCIIRERVAKELEREITNYKPGFEP